MGEKMKFHPHPVRRLKEENKPSTGKSRTSYVSVTRACNKPGAGIVSWKLTCVMFILHVRLVAPLSQCCGMPSPIGTAKFL